MKTTAPRHREQGAVAIETALIFPILVVLLFGIIEFSIVLYNKAMVTNASREGARAGIVYSPDPANPKAALHPSDSVITQTVNNYLNNYLISFGGTSQPTVKIERAGDSPGDPLTVDVTYGYKCLLLPNFITGVDGTIMLSARTVMRME